MKIFSIQYTNKEFEGCATVQAKDAFSATLVLKALGTLNANPYKIIQIKELGCNCVPHEQLITDVYNKVSTIGDIPSTPDTPTPDNPDNPDTPSDNKFDVNSLTKEDIEILKLKLNQGTGTLYVDRIGELRRKAEAGHTVLYSSQKYIDDLPEGLHPQIGHLYIKQDSELGYNYKEYGVPTKYQYIESPSRKVRLNNYLISDSAGNFHTRYKVETVQSFKKKRLAIFQLKNNKKVQVPNNEYDPNDDTTLRHMGNGNRTGWQYLTTYNGLLNKEAVKAACINLILEDKKFRKQGKVPSYRPVLQPYILSKYYPNSNIEDTSFVPEDKDGRKGPVFIFAIGEYKTKSSGGYHKYSVQASVFDGRQVEFDNCYLKSIRRIKGEPIIKVSIPYFKLNLES